MKFSIRNDVLKKVLQKFLIDYPIILTYSENEFKINQLIGEETLILYKINNKFMI